MPVDEYNPFATDWMNLYNQTHPTGDNFLDMARNLRLLNFTSGLEVPLTSDLNITQNMNSLKTQTASWTNPVAQQSNDRITKLVNFRNTANGVFSNLTPVALAASMYFENNNNQFSQNLNSVENTVGSMLPALFKPWFYAGKLANGLSEKATWGDANVVYDGDRFANHFIGLSLLNAIGKKKLNTFSQDDTTIERTGGSYMGNSKLYLRAHDISGGTVGLFGRIMGKTGKYNRLLNEANHRMELQTDIANNAWDQQQIASNTSDLNSWKHEFGLNGTNWAKHSLGYHKLGAKIELIKSKRFKKPIDLESKPKYTITEPIGTFKEGGSLEYTITDIPKKQEGGNLRPIEELIEYAKTKNPRFVARMSEPVKAINFTNDLGEYSVGTHYLEYSETPEGDYVYPRILEMEDGQLKFLSSDDAYNRAREKDNGLLLNWGEGKIFTENYKQGWPDFFNRKFKEGGQMNVIPEGALHARKHNMDDDENITKKGIPVVDKEGKQQAEVERNEIIFSLEVTLKLEELYKKWEDSNSDEQYAIQAGKLLVKEILYNTDDRTGLIEQVEDGTTK